MSGETGKILDILSGATPETRREEGRRGEQGVYDDIEDEEYTGGGERIYRESGGHVMVYVRVGVYGWRRKS